MCSPRDPVSTTPVLLGKLSKIKSYHLISKWVMHTYNLHVDSGAEVEVFEANISYIARSRSA